MKVSLIQKKEDYEAALREVERLLDIGSDAAVLDELATQIEAYEDKHYPIPSPNLIARISYFLESRGYFKS